MAERRDITIGNKVYPILYSANGLRRLERETGHPTSRIGLLLISGAGGFDLLQCVMWAGLEGARLKLLTRPNPFTVDEVGDLIDELGGPEVAWDIEDGSNPKTGWKGSQMAVAVLEAWQSAFPKQQRRDLPKGDAKNDVAPSPEQTSGGATDATQPSSQD